MGYRPTGRRDNEGDDNGEWESTGECSTHIAGIMKVYISCPYPGSCCRDGSGNGQGQVGKAHKLFQLPGRILRVCLGMNACWRPWCRRRCYTVRLVSVHVFFLSHLILRCAGSLYIAALDVAGLEAGISGERNLKWIKLLELLYEAGTVGLDSSAASVASGLLGSGDNYTWNESKREWERERRRGCACWGTDTRGQAFVSEGATGDRLDLTRTLEVHRSRFIGDGTTSESYGW